MPNTWSGQRIAICVLDAHGTAMQQDDALAFASARGPWMLLSADSARYWRRGAPIRVRDDGRLELHRAHQGVDEAEERPKLSTPTIAELIGTAGPAASIASKDRGAMLEAMQVAATRRVEGILGNKRRVHYGHAARLVACCLELAPATGTRDVVAEWVGELRKTYSRLHAFQEECRSALTSISS